MKVCSILLNRTTISSYKTLTINKVAKCPLIKIYNILINSNNSNKLKRELMPIKNKKDSSTRSTLNSINNTNSLRIKKIFIRLLTIVTLE